MKHVFSRVMAITLSAVLLLLPGVPAQAVTNGTEKTQIESVETYNSIDGLSGEILYDTDGNRVYACGGEVHKIEENGQDKYYWFGVDDLNAGPGFQNNTPGIHLYSSLDLYNWKYEGVMYYEQDEIYAHPKMLYNGEEYVMWVSTCTKSDDGTIYPGPTKVVSSQSITEPFTLVREQLDTGFINLYEEALGNAYLIHYQNISNTAGMAGYGTVSITKLSSDYKTTVGETHPLNFSAESLTNTEGGIIKQNGKYYFVNAGMNEYASASSLNGTWTKHSLQMWDGKDKKNIPSKNQTSDVFRVRTQDSDLWVCVGDSVNGGDEPRYIWLPIKFFDDGTIALWELSNWKLGDIDGVQPEEPGEPGNYGNIPGLSGRVLYDTDGKKIYACGGQVYEIEENGQRKWYWFGVDDLNPEKMNEHPGVHLYSSSDLNNWDYEGVMLNEEGITYAHPKILYNGEKYVMWVSYMSSVTEGSMPPMTSGGVRVATSNSIKGPFIAISDSDVRNDYGFFNLYEESEGKAWLIYTDYSINSTSGSHLFRVKLKDDYTGIEGEAQPFRFSSDALSNAEGGIFEKDGKFYMVNSGMGQYAVADSLDGEWKIGSLRMWDGTEYKNIPMPNQTSHVFNVKTQEADTYVCMGDSVGGAVPGTTPTPVCYIWLPIEFFEDGTIALKEERDWSIKGMEPQKPEETEKPEETQNPEETFAPLETEKPEETTVPAETEEPGETEKPVQTIKPEETKKPVQTMKPEETNKPIGTGNPNETAKPTQTSNTTETTMPSETKKPEETEKPVEVKSVLVVTKKLTLGIGEKIQLEAVVYPRNAVDAKLTYTASNAKVSVSPDGMITGKKLGICKITIAAPNGKKAVVKVTVKKKPGKITLNARNKSLRIGKKFKIKVRLPKGTASQSLTYASNKRAIADVSPEGKVTAKKKGYAVITVKTYNGKKAFLKIHVK